MYIKKILVTGGAGFIGSHLVDKLIEDGYMVVCVDNFILGRKENLREALESQNFNMHRFDILEIKKLEDLFNNERFDVVFHLAANSDIAQSCANPIIDLQNTFMTTYNILEMMRRYNVKRLVFASTSAVYGESEMKLAEDHGPLLPISHYGAAKLASEAFISSFCENFNIRAWIIRFPNVIGDRLTHGVIYDFINKLLKNSSELQVMGDGKQTKPYLYISDLIESIIFILKNTNEKINCYNVAADSATSVDKIVGIVIDKMKLKNVNIRYTGQDRGWVGDVPRFSYDTTKLKNLGWKPSMTSDEAVVLAVEKELYHRGLIH